MDLGLGGRGYLLTGASRGLGFATARALVGDGARVLVSSRGQESVDTAVALHGRSLPRPPPASSTSPYLASWRRWKEQLAALSPIRSPAWVAVSGPVRRSSPISASRIGWA